MGDVGAPELLIILVVVLLVFGGAKLPELARSLGKAKNEFHKGLDEGMSGASDGRQVDSSATEATAPTERIAPVADPASDHPKPTGPPTGEGGTAP